MKLLYCFLILTAIFLQPVPSGATEIFARQTGKSCSACHIDPAGGGELTQAGKAFAATRAAGANKANSAATAAGAREAAGSGLAAKLIRFVAGYLHLITAILWFGTILYVHLVLKPAYAAGGLPRGEVRVGVASMAVMGITGLILTHFRVTSLDILLHTRFGILLLVKVGLYLVMVGTAIYVVSVIGPKLKAKRREEPAPLRGDLTTEQLSSCDGKEGRPALFAFQGRIYDATGNRLWKQGVHMGRHNAGMDLTEALKLAPHGSDKIAGLPDVGALLAQGEAKPPLHERVFFFMAYMNLTIVFLIVFVVALWRWAW
jgi:predicted heme/steroid binding protein